MFTLNLKLLRRARETMDMMEDYGEDRFYEGKLEGKLEGKVEATVEDTISIMEEFDIDIDKALGILKVPDQNHDVVKREVENILLQKN